MNGNAPILTELAMVGSMALLLLLESFFPWRAGLANPLWRWFNNLALIGLSFALLLLATPLIYLFYASMLGPHWQGLLQHWRPAPWLAFAVTLLVMECVLYWMHRASHAWRWLWRLHLVHHADTEFDVTTAHRAHPLEVLLSSSVLALPLLLLGPDPGIAVIYNLISLVGVKITHSNLSFGVLINRWLGWLIVTPDHHRIHHCADRPLTDSHYGSLLSLFDTMFGTRQPMPAAESRVMPIGLEYFREPACMRLDQMLCLPWRTQTAQFNRPNTQITTKCKG